MFFLHAAEICGRRNFIAIAAQGLNGQVGPFLFGQGGLVHLVFVFSDALAGHVAHRSRKLGVGAGETFILRFMQHQQFGGAVLGHSGGAVGLVGEERDLANQVAAFGAVTSAVPVRQTHSARSHDIEFIRSVADVEQGFVFDQKFGVQ